MFETRRTMGDDGRVRGDFNADHSQDATESDHLSKQHLLIVSKEKRSYNIDNLTGDVTETTTTNNSTVLHEPSPVPDKLTRRDQSKKHVKIATL